MLILLLCFYMLVAHWLACIWYSIGRSDAENGVSFPISISQIFYCMAEFIVIACVAHLCFIQLQFDFVLSQVQYSWLWKLANVTQSPYSYVWMNDTNTPEIINGPSKKTMYVTALYFTMSCMTSVTYSIRTHDAFPTNTDTNAFVVFRWDLATSPPRLITKECSQYA